MTTPVTWITPPANEDGTPRTLKTCSVSRMQMFENCPRQLALKALFKIPEPERPGEPANVRGSRLHDAAEKFIRGEVAELEPEIKHHRGLMEELRERWADRSLFTLVEERWMFDEDWVMAYKDDFDNAWLIALLDACTIDGDEARAIDWKSGKKQGNEIKHADQLMVYAMCVLMRYSQIERVTTELRYIDVGEKTIRYITRADLNLFMPRLNRRLRAVTEATAFPPKPSLNHCRFCAYKTGKIVKGVEGTGHCDLNP